MATTLKKQYGLYIHPEVLHSERCAMLTFLDKNVLSYIVNFTTNGKYNHCFAKNETIAKQLKCAKNTVSRIVNKLVKTGFVEFIRFNGRSRLCRSIGFESAKPENEPPPVELDDEFCDDVNSPEFKYTKPIRFIATACDNEFSDTEMRMLVKELPHFGTLGDKLDSQRYDYLNDIYLRFKRHTENNLVTRRFEYFMSMVKNE
ncbi:MAG: helix-turn-helix domain-containing protein [Oscillospiraceae bacterium]|nr:helix-turn-helix domain-containing protein [Oscillospiraceae bacterium]